MSDALASSHPLSVSLDFTADNPVIDRAGTATFGAGKFCTWKTNNGSVSSVIITNPGNQNTLTFLVSGAPATIMATGPGGTRQFNGPWSIPPNSPSINVTAFGDFLGTIVTILNASNPKTDCKVVAQRAS